MFNHLPSSERPGRIAWIIVLVALIAGLALRIVAITNKQSLTHDESISYLAATANQGAYENVKKNLAYPYGTWVAASEWKTFFIVRERFAFSQIRHDLADSDVHPPLYFWLLHLWTMIFGVHIWTGPTLNLLLFLLSAVALYRLTRRLLQNDLEAALVTSIWAVSPALIEITITARQYELLGLCTILFVGALLQYVDTSSPLSWLKWLALVLTVTAGAMTHFHFALVVAGGTLIFLMPLYRSAPSRLFTALVGFGVGYLLFLLLHPQFFHSWQTLAFRQNEVAQIYWTALDFIQRVYAIAFTHTRFWVYGGILQTAVFCLFTSFVIWFIWAFVRNRTNLFAYIQQRNMAGVEGIYFFLWMTIVTMLLYLALLSPLNAMTPRHMSPAWPFAAFIPILMLRSVSKGRQWLQGTLVGIVFLSGLTMVYFDYSVLVSSISLDQFDVLVVDIVHDGILPRIVRQIPAQTSIFAADQAYLLTQPEAWLTRLDQESGYISDLSYTNSQEGQAQIIDLIAESLRVEVEEISGEFDGGRVYQWQAQSP